MIHRAEPFLGKYGMLQKLLGQILVRLRQAAITPMKGRPSLPFTPAIGATPKSIPRCLKFVQANGPEIIMASLSWPIISSTAQSRID
jgi:hypothetical protein